MTRHRSRLIRQQARLAVVNLLGAQLATEGDLLESDNLQGAELAVFVGEVERIIARIERTIDVG